MKKLLVTALAVLMVLGLTAGTASAVTTVDTTWSGSGNVAGNFQVNDDMTASFLTGGSTISGSWHGTAGAIDHDCSPTTSDFSASFTNGGVQYDEYRLDSFYGAGDEYIGSYISTPLGGTGSGSLDQHIYTNWASLYALTDPSTVFTATGDYLAGHQIKNGANFGQWTASGDGTMTIAERVDTANYYGSTDWTLGGGGAGCWGNAIATFTGSGVFDVNAYSAGSMHGNGWSSSGPVTYSQGWDFDTGLTVNDFSLSGN